MKKRYYVDVPKCVRENMGVKTEREWRAMKRVDIRQLALSFDYLRLGSAYLPEEAYAIVQRIGNDIEELKSLCSVKKWRR